MEPNNSVMYKRTSGDRVSGAVHWGGTARRLGHRRNADLNHAPAPQDAVGGGRGRELRIFDRPV